MPTSLVLTETSLQSTPALVQTAPNGIQFQIGADVYHRTGRNRPNRTLVTVLHPCGAILLRKLLPTDTQRRDERLMELVSHWSGIMVRPSRALPAVDLVDRVESYLL
jgi:hypothetical protein